MYAPRLADLQDPEAALQELEALKKDIDEKGWNGFFDTMNAKGTFTYVYESYAAVFGAEFWDDYWQSYATMRASNESDRVKAKIVSTFEVQLNDAIFNLYNVERREQWYSSHERTNAEEEMIRKTWADAFSAYFGYGDMTPGERYHVILSDYGAAGEKSYAATFKMLWLLGRTGAVGIEETDHAMVTLRQKMEREYAALDMTVADMAMSRFANALYGFDADAEVLNPDEYLQREKEQTTIINLHSTRSGMYSKSKLVPFLEKLLADLKALGAVPGHFKHRMLFVEEIIYYRAWKS